MCGMSADRTSFASLHMTRTAEDPTAARKPAVLLAQSDDHLRALIPELLEKEGYQVSLAANGEEALRVMAGPLFDVILIELELPRLHGLTVLEAAATLQPNAQFIVLARAGSIATAVEAMKLGARDYLTAPFRTADVLVAVAGARAEAQQRRVAAQLPQLLAESDPRARIIGRSPAMDRMFDMIGRVAPMRATVLITGETGTGKELVARAIHQLSPRARKPFIAVNCSALPETLLESELFGHVRGSFTGAIANKRGLFEEAAGGTLFLDEISTISAQTQVKLLRVLEEHAIQRVGSTQQIHVDFRLVTATNQDIAQLVQDGRFREDLFYRLNVFPVEVPALRERRTDIPLLANHFRFRIAEENQLEAPPFSAATIAHMSAYDWPGNVRELENFVERALIQFAGRREIRFEPPSARRRPELQLVARGGDEDWNLDRLEREYILTVLEKTKGHRGRAAEALGIDRRTLYRKLRAMNVSVTSFGLDLSEVLDNEAAGVA
jgi:DNA-binding NtrC family response regulator